MSTTILEVYYRVLSTLSPTVSRNYLKISSFETINYLVINKSPTQLLFITAR
jgi:hypothetical protein